MNRFSLYHGLCSLRMRSAIRAPLIGIGRTRNPPVTLLKHAAAATITAIKRWLVRLALPTTVLSYGFRFLTSLHC
jgi:hypothetical protein